MVDKKFWAYFAGARRLNVMRDKWEEELVIAEYRLKERARAEKRLQAVEETSKPPNKQGSALYLGPTRSPSPEPVPPEPTPVPFVRESDPRLWQTKYSLEEATLATAITSDYERFHSLSDSPSAIKQKLEEDVRWNENLFPYKHPLQVQYENARRKAIGRGNADPGGLEHILEACWPCHRLEQTWAGQTGPSMTYRDPNGTLVQRGFDTSNPDPPGFEAEPYNTVHKPTAHAFVNRVRSHTFDDRLVSAHFLAQDFHAMTPEERYELRCPTNRNVVAKRILERESRRASRGTPLTTVDGVDDPVDLLDVGARMLRRHAKIEVSTATPDHAEGIATYCERMEKRRLKLEAERKAKERAEQEAKESGEVVVVDEQGAGDAAADSCVIESDSEKEEEDDGDNDAQSDNASQDSATKAFFRSLDTMDPAEGIAAYHERQAMWFGPGTGGSRMARRPYMGTV